MIRPMLLYWYLIFPSIAENAKKELQSNQDRTLTIILSNNMMILKMDPLAQAWSKRVSVDAYKSLYGSCPLPFLNMFVRLKHYTDRQGNSSRLILPKVKTQAG